MFSFKNPDNLDPSEESHIWVAAVTVLVTVTKEVMPSIAVITQEIGPLTWQELLINSCPDGGFVTDWYADRLGGGEQAPAINKVPLDAMLIGQAKPEPQDWPANAEFGRTISQFPAIIGWAHGNDCAKLVDARSEAPAPRTLQIDSRFSCICSSQSQIGSF
jgi:hypothetical protein